MPIFCLALHKGGTWGWKEKARIKIQGNKSLRHLRWRESKKRWTEMRNGGRLWWSWWLFMWHVHIPTGSGGHSNLIIYVMQSSQPGVGGKSSWTDPGLGFYWLRQQDLQSRCWQYCSEIGPGSAVRCGLQRQEWRYEKGWGGRSWGGLSDYWLEEQMVKTKMMRNRGRERKRSVHVSVHVHTCMCMLAIQGNGGWKKIYWVFN